MSGQAAAGGPTPLSSSVPHLAQRGNLRNAKRQTICPGGPRRSGGLGKQRSSGGGWEGSTARSQHSQVSAQLPGWWAQREQKVLGKQGRKCPRGPDCAGWGGPATGRGSLLDGEGCPLSVSPLAPSPVTQRATRLHAACKVKEGVMGHPQALGEQHNQVWSYQHLAENGHQMTGHFPRGSGE